MIRAGDLMIGDWVKTVCPKQESYERVSDIHFSNYPYIITAGSEEKWFLVEVEPIPLTPEILQKNGFKKSESDTLSQTWAWAEKSEKIYNRWVQVTFYNEPINDVSYLTKIETCSSKGDGVNHLHSCDIESVHELQHALKLCGIEKEIVV